MKQKFSIERIEVKQATSVYARDRVIRIQLVGFVTEEVADAVVECWRKHDTAEIEEMLTNTGHVVTIDFKGDKE